MKICKSRNFTVSGKNFIPFLRIVAIAFVVISTLLAAAGASSASTGSFFLTDPMGSARSDFPAIKLQDGSVLVAGGDLASAELYDPSTDTWTLTGSMNETRYGHKGTLLNDGRVLVAAGSTYSGVPLSSAELYDPSTGLWSFADSLNVSRYHGHIQCLLQDGKVLVAGGIAPGGEPPTNSTELYNPVTNEWTPTGAMKLGRYSNSEAILLPNGKILVAGGYHSSPQSSAELYDPDTGIWSYTNETMGTIRFLHSTTLLPDGRVLVAGGSTSGGPGGELASTELYNPSTGAWTPGANMTTERYRHTATLLPSGQVLVAGGYNGGAVNSAELYDPSTDTWTLIGSLNESRYAHQAVLLEDDRVLIAGGTLGTDPLPSVELYLSDQESPVACFIATTAYGSYLDGHVDTLRTFRDRYLVTNPVGSALVSTYYKLSPPVAEFIDEHPALKPIVRAGLLPAVAISTVAINTTLAETMAIVGSLALFSIGVAMWLRKRRCKGSLY